MHASTVLMGQRIPHSSVLVPPPAPPLRIGSAGRPADGGAAWRPLLELRQVLGQRLLVPLEPGGVQPDRLERLQDAALGARVWVLQEELLHLDGALLGGEVLRERLDQLSQQATLQPEPEGGRGAGSQ